MFNRGRQYLPIAPSAIAALEYRCCLNVEFSCPLRRTLSSTLVSKVDIACSIGRLLATRRPSHIAGFVVPVVIDSIQSMPQRRSQTYEVKERRKVVLPFFIHVDTSSTVSRIAFIGLHVASLLNRGPYAVLGSSPHAVLSAQAATRSRFLVSQSRTADTEHGVATITNAVPNKSAKTVLTGKGEDGEALESLSVLNVHDPILADSADAGAVTRRGVLAHDAAARFLHVVIELAGRGLGEIAARTLALPEGLAPLVLADAPKHGKSVKFLSNCDSLAGGRHVLISIKNALAWLEGLVPFGPLYFTTE